MKNPLLIIPAAWRKTLVWPLFGLVILLIAVFGISGTPMNTVAAPYGVVSFELAGNVPRASEILASWNSDARERAAFGLGLDFLFIPVYAVTIALGCGLSAASLQRRGWPLSSLGNYLAWGVFLAGLLDIIENIALIVVLFGRVVLPWPQIAAVCAICKFTLLFLGLVYTLFGAVVTLLKPGN
jgi:hypothetical protein